MENIFGKGLTKKLRVLDIQPYNQHMDQFQVRHSAIGKCAHGAQCELSTKLLTNFEVSSSGL